MKKTKLLMMMSISAILALAACGPTKPNGESSSELPPSSDNGNGQTSTEIDGGDGSAKNPFKLSTKDDLIALQEEVNADNFNGFVSDVTNAPYFELTANIDLGGMEWTPIGGSLNQTGSNLFSANINGNGHTISNFKITETDTSISSYGLIGNFHGNIENLNVSNFTIDLAPSAVYSNTTVGGLVGLADIASFTNINVDGSIKVRYNKNNADFYIGGLTGYNLTYATPFNGKLLGNVTNTRFITTDVKIDSNVASTFAGGITGWAGTNSGAGILNMAYLVSKGKLVTSNITGGIAGYLDKYATISYAQVYGNVEGGANVGGIVAIAASDSAIQNSFVASKQIVAMSLSQSFEFEGGYIAGLFTQENEPESDAKSTLMRNVYASDATLLAVAGTAHEDIHHTPIETISNLIDKNFLKSHLEYSENEWTFAPNAYPTLKDSKNIDFTSKSQVSFVSNLDGVNKDKQTALTYTFSSFDSLVSKKGYTFKGWFYDKDFKYDYRFYLPLYGDKTLYGDWANYSEFAGMYVATKYNAGIFDFDSFGGLNFYYGDYTYIKGSYQYFGNYIKFGSPDSYDWDNTYASWDKTKGELKFKASNNNATEFTYVKANELIGFYRNGKIAIDFVTDNAGTITIPGKYDVKEIAFEYDLKTSEIVASSKDGKLTSIKKLSDGTIEFVYDGVTYSNNEKIPFISNSEKAPYSGKTYRGAELNEKYGVKDVTFNADGTVTFRHSYKRVNYSQDYLDLYPDLVDEEKEIYGGTKTRDGETDATYFLDIYGINKNNDGSGTYSYSEITQLKQTSNNAVLDDDGKVLSTNMVKSIDEVTGIMAFTGTGKVGSTEYIYEVFVDINPDTYCMSVNQYASYNHQGGYYADGNEIIIKGDGSDQSMQAVLQYNEAEDYFVTKSTVTETDPSDPSISSVSEKFFLLAPHAIKGVFNIKADASEGLDGEIYAYEGHTYYLAKDGTVSKVEIIDGDFDLFSKVTLQINGKQFMFSVTNLYGNNTLSIIK